MEQKLASAATGDLAACSFVFLQLTARTYTTDLHHVESSSKERNVERTSKELDTKILDSYDVDHTSVARIDLVDSDCSFRLHTTRMRNTNIRDVYRIAATEEQ